MSWNTVRALCLLTSLVLSSCFSCATDRQPTIVANDNRSPAGELRDGTLTIGLELGEGQWHPESEEGEALTVYAFGERGSSLQNPGPLIRVPKGTEIHVTAHNTLSVTATVHGLHERPGNEKDVLILQPGSTKDVRFKAGEAGRLLLLGFHHRQHARAAHGDRNPAGWSVHRRPDGCRHH